VAWFDPTLAVDPVVVALLIWLTADHINLKTKIAEMREDLKYLKERIDELAAQNERRK